MTSIKIQDLEEGAFQPFGWILGQAVPTTGLFFSNADTDFWEEHPFEPGTGGEAQILWVNYRDTRRAVTQLEVHKLTEQAVVPLTGEIVQIVALSRQDGSLDLESVAAFRVRTGEGICMRAGCWHTTRVDADEVRCLMLTRESTTEKLIGYLKGRSQLSETALADADLEIA
jgi:ureidoglycolate lyase